MKFLTLKPIFLSVYLITIILVSCDNGTKPTDHVANEKTSAILDNIGDSLISRIVINNVNKSVPGVLIGATNPDNNFSYLKAFGKSDIASNQPLFRGDLFRIGGLTHTFISTLVFKLVEQGTLGLDDPINKYLQVPHSGSILTIRHLLSMKSGLPDYTDSINYYLTENPKRKFSQEQLLNFTFNAMPLSYPGQKLHFALSNYFVLGVIIEKATGNSLEDELKKNIIEPLGLSDTFFNSESDFLGRTHARGYEFDEFNNLEDVTDKYNYSWAWGSANIISDTRDLMKWAEAFTSGRLISQESLAIMKKFEVMQNDSQYKLFMGSGMMQIGPFIGYTGSINGFYTHLYHLPSKGITILITTNSPNDNSALFIRIAELIIPGVKYN
ncbi:MAG: beta-lactamase family protein [Candidatus Kapabacteria bacterium]|nr:beta-lactamase family protein [Ignavibacteriota bacterium]MCW5884357.1 beta-lactamase family protein [Candidatus Kapabacteria bacterium]